MLKTIEGFAVECSVNKVFTSEALAYVVDEALQVFGGNGYSREFPAERAYRDARITRIYEGTNEINRMIIPTRLLKAGAASLQDDETRPPFERRPAGGRADRAGANQEPGDRHADEDGGGLRRRGARAAGAHGPYRRRGHRGVRGRKRRRPAPKNCRAARGSPTPPVPALDMSFACTSPTPSIASCTRHGRSRGRSARSGAARCAGC